MAESASGAQQAVASVLPGNTHPRPRLALGPAYPGIGSWEWIAADMAHELSAEFDVATFKEALPECDVLVVIKYPPPFEHWGRVPRKTALVYCPVDYYESSGKIDRDWRFLRRCDRVIVHCRHLRKYFQSYTRVEFLDHHIKFAAPLREEFREEGPILWAGMRNNLPPLVEWVNAHRLPGELIVLTNVKDGEDMPTASALGFRDAARVRIERWSPERHKQLTAQARAALDVKGDDFRPRHKPPVKAIDFIASGVPLAMNAESSSVRDLRERDFEVARPEDRDYWLSREYWEATRDFGRQLRSELTRTVIGRRFRTILEDALAGRRQA